MKAKKVNFSYVILRIAAIIGMIFLLIPSFNAARITSLINKNLSLFTTGISFNQLTDGFGKALRKGWITREMLAVIMVCSLICCIGIILQGIAACATLGNNRLKRMGTKGGLAGAVISLLGLAGVLGSCRMLQNLPDAEKLSAALPTSFFWLCALELISLLASVIALVMGERADKSEKLYIEPKYQLFLMAFPFIVMTLVFGYLPLMGWRYAFFDYKAGDALTAENFVGGKWFVYLLGNVATRNDIIRVMKNTLGMSGLGLATSWVSMIFAVFLNEIKNEKYRRFIQTFTTIPNFISWVLIFAVALSIFSADGFISNLMQSTGQWSSGKNLLMNDNHVWIQMLLWGMWKGVGWGAIVYIAAIAGIDQELYEAARVDGAGRFSRMRYITIPELMPTYCVLLLLSVGNLLSNGLDQYLVFENSVNSASIQVLDLYVYNLGISKGLIPLTTAIGMLKSVVSVFLVLAANRIAKMVRGTSII